MIAYHTVSATEPRRLTSEDHDLEPSLAPQTPPCPPSFGDATVWKDGGKDKKITLSADLKVQLKTQNCS